MEPGMRELYRIAFFRFKKRTKCAVTGIKKVKGVKTKSEMG